MVIAVFVGFIVLYHVFSSLSLSLSVVWLPLSAIKIYIQRSSYF